MYVLVTYVELIYELAHTLKRTVACVCVSFLAKYMPIFYSSVIGGGHLELLSNHWRKKMETIFFGSIGCMLVEKSIHLKST